MSIESRREPSSGRKLIYGALAGFLATGPMSAVMLLLYHKLLPPHEKQPLPPRLITDRLLRRSGAKKAAPTDQQERFLTWISHFGYGTAAGSLFPWFYQFVRLPSALSGMLYGILVWAGSYLGWLPAANILPPATKTSPRRNSVMIAAHLVWGTVLGLVTSQWEGMP